MASICIRSYIVSQSCISPKWSSPFPLIFSFCSEYYLLHAPINFIWIKEQAASYGSPSHWEKQFSEPNQYNHWVGSVCYPLNRKGGVDRECGTWRCEGRLVGSSHNKNQWTKNFCEDYRVDIKGLRKWWLHNTHEIKFIITFLLFSTIFH